MSPACIWDAAATTAAPIVKAMAIERDVVVMMISFLAWADFVLRHRRVMTISR
jgi:hypothetical protein